jgi:RNA polymerase sigma factor (sigma-70 family)
MRFLDRNRSPGTLTGSTEPRGRCAAHARMRRISCRRPSRAKLARPRLLRGEEAELAYLLRVLRNTFLTGRRDAGRRPVTTATLEDVVAADPRPTLAPDQALEVGEIYEAIAELPEHYRLALVAIDLLGLSYREVARAVGVGEQTITTRLFRARRLVARRFSGEPVDGPSAAASAQAGEPARGDRTPGLPEDASRSSAARRRTAPGTGITARQGSLSEGIGL